MASYDLTSTSIDENSSVAPRTPMPVLLVAHYPEDALSIDRCRLSGLFTIGRNPENTLTVRDHKISGKHFQILVATDGCVIDDLDSTNGTYLNGRRIYSPTSLCTGDIIRAGNVVFVFHQDGEDLLIPPPIKRYGLAGKFHAAAIIKSLEEAALSKRHLLIVGPSGTGKELAAEALAALACGDRKAPFVAHNAARFSSEEEATSTLFGVGSRVFSNVNSRQGLIEQAEGGVLFLDEIHNLTERVQRSLLRVIEDRQYSRIGETSQRNADVRFIMASNASSPSASMAHDLFARLRLVTMPSLSERRGDIPSIFNHILVSKLESYNIPSDSVLSCLKGDHYELLCLDGFPIDNVRGLIDIADRIATKIAAQTAVAEAVSAVFLDKYPNARKSAALVSADTHVSKVAVVQEKEWIDEPTELDADDGDQQSTYEKYKDVIIAIYKDREENISAAMRTLNARGIPCSRRWLAVYLKKWGLK